MGRHVARSSDDRWRRQGLLVTSLFLLAVAAVSLRAAMSGPDASRAAVAAVRVAAGSATSPDVVDWVSVLEVLDRRRSLAFTRQNPALLRAVYRAGSKPLREDQALLVSYIRHGLRVTGLQMTLLDVRLLDSGRRGAHLRVVDRLTGGALVGYGGRPVAVTTDRPTARHITLVRRPLSGWRIADLRAVNSSP